MEARPERIARTDIPKRLTQVAIARLSKNAQQYDVKPGEKLFTDRDYALQAVAPELEGMTGIRFSNSEAKGKGVALDFEVAEDAKVLVGFLRRQGPSDAKNPHANWNLALRGALTVRHVGFPAIDVYAYRLPAGRHALDPEDEEIVVAGKNFASFDARFLSKLTNWDKHVKTHHRILDPAAFYWEPALDGPELPDTQTCMDRAGVVGEVAHTAVEDAQVVVRLIRQAIENSRLVSWES